MNIIRANSFEYLPTLRSGSVNLVLTDPPYNLGEAQKDILHAEFLRLASMAIVFAPPENQWVIPADQYGFWVKPTSTKNTSGRYSRFVEMIFFYGKLRWNIGRHWSAYTNVFQELVDDATLHPFRKPPALIERLVRNHTNEGDLVLDPFAGSGVVGEVCERLGRRCISVDWGEEI